MTARNDDPQVPDLHALQLLIAERRDEDPLIGAKVGSELALQWLLQQLKTERGVHAETLMAMAGIVMGQSTQASLWAEAQRNGGRGLEGLHLVRCQDDTCYVIGEPLNRRLMEGYDSPWALLQEAAQQEGCGSLPDGEDVLLEGIQRLCTATFGTPQVPAAHQPEVLKPAEQAELWLLIRPLCLGCCLDPREWPLFGGLLGVRALRLVSAQLAPEVAFRLAMDSAIDAAKIPQEGHGLAEGW